MESTNTPGRGLTNPTPTITSVSSSKVLKEDLIPRNPASAPDNGENGMNSPVGPVPQQQSVVDGYPGALNFGQETHGALCLRDYD